MFLVLFPFQNSFKESQLESEASRASRDELALANKDLEKKFKAMEAELIRSQQDLASSERARKELLAEKDELAEEMANASKSVSALFKLFAQLYTIDVLSKSNVC